MVKEKTQPANNGDDQQPQVLKPASNVTMQRVKVPLSKIVMDPDRYCHRDSRALEVGSLQSLMDSLILEGMQVPIEGYYDDSERFVLVKGHRRVQSHLELVRKNTPGFTAGMELEAIVLENHTPQDLLVRSIADNEVRLNLDRIGRIRAAKKMYDFGVEEGRAAAALGVSVKTYQRDLLIAKYGWMFQHVIDDSMEATTAYSILGAAEQASRLSEVKDDLDAWIAGKKRLIREKARLRKLQGGKELSPAEKQVKRLMPKHLITHWIELIQRGERFDEESEWEFPALIDKEKGQLRISSVSLDLGKSPPEQIAKVASKLSRLSAQLGPILEERLSEQQGEEVDDEIPYDLDYLERHGAKTMAERLKERFEKAKTATSDGEDVTQEVPEERKEVDLASQVDLPAVNSLATEAAPGKSPQPEPMKAAELEEKK